MSWSTKRNFSSSSVVSTPTSPSPVELVIYFYVLCGTLDFIGKGGVEWIGLERIEIEMTRKDLASLGLFD